MTEVTVRQLQEDDKAFLFATYLRNHWFSKDNKTTLAKETFMRIYHKRMEDLMKTVPIKVLCLTEDPTVILGYSIEEKQDKKFVYLKKAFRNLGLERML